MLSKTTQMPRFLQRETAGRPLCVTMRHVWHLYPSDVQDLAGGKQIAKTKKKTQVILSSLFLGHPVIPSVTVD